MVRNLINRPDDLLICPDELINRPDELINRPDDLLIRPDGLFSAKCLLTGCLRRKQVNFLLLYWMFVVRQNLFLVFYNLPISAVVYLVTPVVLIRFLYVSAPWMFRLLDVSPLGRFAAFQDVSPPDVERFLVYFFSRN